MGQCNNKCLEGRSKDEIAGDSRPHLRETLDYADENNKEIPGPNGSVFIGHLDTKGLKQGHGVMKWPNGSK